jgi:hypothetical protein
MEDEVLLRRVEQTVERAVGEIFSDDREVWGLGTDSHEEDYIGVSESVEHGDLVAELVDELLCDVWVEDFLYGHGSGLEIACVDDAEPA